MSESTITDEDIVAALTELYIRKANGDNGYLCISLDPINETLTVQQWPSQNYWIRMEEDGKIWDCPHVHAIWEHETPYDILKGLNYDVEYERELYPEKTDGEMLIELINGYGFDSAMIEHVRDDIAPHLEVI